MDIEDSYTTQEVARKLGVSKVTVYQYGKQGKIRKIKDPFSNVNQTRYARKEVDELVEERNLRPSGLSVSEAAQALGVAKPRIYSLIKDGILEAQEIYIGDESKRLIIQEAPLNYARKWLEEQKNRRAAKWEFYDRDNDVALYQLFESKDGQTYRLMKNDKGDWGFYLPPHTWVGYKEALKTLIFTPTYKIHKKTLRRSKFYVDFKLPKDNSATYEILDTFYIAAGVENLRLREVMDTILLSIKEGIYEVPEGSQGQLDIMEAVHFGECIERDGEISICSNYKRQYYDLPEKYVEQFLLEADKQNLTQHELLEKVIDEYLQKGNQK
ncbi:helix-turn-helix domain-containing protein [Viridibacillus arvi]|uniref:helix-turn-helix domain-containing protein n=1 Tax=Viridibacillus arvi TaxID=263475 RepID=UPI0034CDF120